MNPKDITETTTAERCIECDAASFTTSLQDQTFVYGSGSDRVSLTARVPVIRCDSCGFEFTDERGENVRHAAICQHLGVLTPEEIVTLRHARGMTQAEFARLTRFGEASIKRWESGAGIQNASADQFLRLIQDDTAFQKLLALAARRARGDADTNVVSLEDRFMTKLDPEKVARAREFQLRHSG